MFYNLLVLTGWTEESGENITIQTTVPYSSDTPGDRLGEVKGRSDGNRTALLISSTSWTEDEDFGLLLESLIVVDERLVAYFDNNRGGDSPVSSIFSRLLVVVTGKDSCSDCRWRSGTSSGGAHGVAGTTRVPCSHELRRFRSLPSYFYIRVGSADEGPRLQLNSNPYLHNISASRRCWTCSAVVFRCWQYIFPLS